MLTELLDKTPSTKNLNSGLFCLVFGKVQTANIYQLTTNR